LSSHVDRGSLDTVRPGALMKFVAGTKWEYYVANVAGILAILGLLVWFISRAVTVAGIDFKSIFFWLSLLLLITIPFALISFFSSMKAIEATTKGLIISYVFQKHKNEIAYSEITEIQSSRTDRETMVRPRTIRDSFKLVLADGRVFEVARSQFNQYDQLKSICIKNMKSSSRLTGTAHSSALKKRGR
jgi:hypothetical protein